MLNTKLAINDLVPSKNLALLGILQLYGDFDLFHPQRLSLLASWPYADFKKIYLLRPRKALPAFQPTSFRWGSARGCSCRRSLDGAPSESFGSFATNVTTLVDRG